MGSLKINGIRRGDQRIEATEAPEITTESGQVRKRRTLPRLTLGIQARLVILVLATVLPLVGLASFAMIRTVDGERARIERDAKP